MVYREEEFGGQARVADAFCAVDERGMTEGSGLMEERSAGSITHGWQFEQSFGV